MSSLSECCEATTCWMRSNRLQPNPGENKVLWCTPAGVSINCQHCSPLIDNCFVDQATYIDCDLSMRTHVTRTVSRCFAALRQLRQIRRSVPAVTFHTMVVSLVHSGLGYGNAVLASLPAYLQRCLQSMLNAVARLLVFICHGLGFRDHITDALICLQWLRVPQRIEFKLAALTYKFLFNQSTALPRASLVRVADVPGRRALRSHRLLMPSVRLSSIGGRAFPVAAPRTWNVLGFAKRCYICTVIIFFLAASQDLSLSAILSGHHCDT